MPGMEDMVINNDSKILTLFHGISSQGQVLQIHMFSGNRLAM